MTRFLISRDDWSLHRKGYMDQERHQERVREAIRSNLPDLITEEGVITSDGKKIVKVPIRSLEEYRFRFDSGKRAHGGTGNGQSKPGDVLGAGPPAGGPGAGAGDGEGLEYYEADVTFEELSELLFADLELPHLDPNKKPILENPDAEFTDVRKQGLLGNLDRRRTLLNAIKRAALAGQDPRSPQIRRDDLRFKTWEEKHRRDSNAVVLAMMDTSGSMGTFEKYMARSFFFWMTRFLRTKYAHVTIHFLAHDTRAKEVDEAAFFSKGESGGTKCSSVYELALNLVREAYPSSQYNIYPFHFTDGDNFPSDNVRCLELVSELLALSSAMGYGEIVGANHVQESTLMQVLERITDPRFVRVTIREKRHVYTALRAFFRKRQV